MSAWLVEAILATALLMAAVLAVRVPVRRAFGAQVAYALWAIPVARMVLPPLPAGWRGEALPVLPTPEPLTLYLGAPVVTLPPVADAGMPIGWAEAAVLLWSAGAVALMAWQVVGYWRFRWRVLHHGVAVDRVKSVTIVQSAAASGPLAFGVIDRVVAFPRDFAARFEAGERALTLEHELGHHARGDLIANWVALAMLALHWFNPLAWIAFRAFRADQELANDAHVLARCGAEARHAYGCAIVKAAHGRAVSPTCHLNTVKDLKGRLRMLGNKGVSRRRVAAGGGAIAALALTALGATASGTQAAERVRTTVEETTGVDIAALKPVSALRTIAAPAVPATPGLPQPPAAPAVPEAGKGRHTRIVVVKDGRTRTYEGADAARYLAEHPLPVPPTPPVPPVVGDVAPPAPPAPPAAWDEAASARDMERHTREIARQTRDIERRTRSAAAMAARAPTVVQRSCGESEGRGVRQTVISSRDGEHRVMIVCTNRIEAMSQQAAAQARVAQRVSLVSLQRARQSVLATHGLSDEQRRHALDSIDRSIDEMKARPSQDD